jgi:MarR family transcriptional regulator for hemolysin
VDGATLVTTLDRLVTAGLVRRDAEPGDRRVKRIVLTPQGDALARQVRTEAASLRRQTVERLDAAALAAAAAVLEELQRLLEDA